MLANGIVGGRGRRCRPATTRGSANPEGGQFDGRASIGAEVNVVSNIERDDDVVAGEFHAVDRADLYSRDGDLVARLDLGGLRELALVAGLAQVELADPTMTAAPPPR